MRSRNDAEESSAVGVSDTRIQGLDHTRETCFTREDASPSPKVLFDIYLMVILFHNGHRKK